MLAFGDIGGQPQYVLRNSGRVAQERKFHVRPDTTSITSKVALLKVEMIHFTPSQLFIGFTVPLDIIRMSHFVEDSDREHLFCGAAKHAPVSWIDGDLPAFDLCDS